MSIELGTNMENPELDFEHRIDHDIESLFLVFLHLVRFTSGPIGNPTEDIYENTLEIKITQWHHDPLISNIPHLKTSDILRLRIPGVLPAILPKYWLPITANIVNLIDIVYPEPTIPLKTGNNIYRAFRAEMEKIFELCRTLEETPHNFGTCMPYQTQTPLKKRKAVEEAPHQDDAQSRLSKPASAKSKSKRNKTTKR